MQKTGHKPLIRPAIPYAPPVTCGSLPYIGGQDTPIEDDVRTRYANITPTERRMLPTPLFEFMPDAKT
ncbi:hypothetical protein K6W37_00090 [Acetobacter senegalensis]|uniref:hypothetical protein n=1 Tax=Acetobacter senegalensis TaxID=446692 RepID=UPI001ED9D306|nr:hypothetical protein [Acetobacter senegalensis]MCG4252304.1 hypothetical protein [Acetobacter senegalensis]